MHNAHPTNSPYVNEANTKVVTMLAKEAGFESIDRHTLSSFSNLLGTYLETLLISTHSLAELANRTRVNYHDIQQCFQKNGIDLSSLELYSEQYNKQNIQAKGKQPIHIDRSKETTIEKIPEFLASDEDDDDEEEDDDEKDSADESIHGASTYVPSYLPRFPSKHSFRQTPVYIDRPDNPQRVRELNSQQSRTVEENLKRLMSAESDILRQRELGSKGAVSPLADLNTTPIVNYETNLQRRKRAKRGKLE
ncbi:uncharacterized protein BX664DRAFT_287576 [Halteromyces radiatus]|uniref:uncharacterized protein n=1 Tax=Halteromyces radiatus TaxID=101107 RepID=UPI00221E8A32|nr:uncharacterized protein BX664DRAFT_287576 [Halteromyces radiatus]KAI8076776.1 hypothetical protein BX664DRAFT_287576 [Halteromyces radiatus]